MIQIIDEKGEDPTDTNKSLQSTFIVGKNKLVEIFEIIKKYHLNTYSKLTVGDNCITDINVSNLQNNFITLFERLRINELPDE